MRRMLGALALALGLGWAASPARAQDHAAQPDEHADAMAAHMEQVHAQLGLSQAQVERLRQVHAAHASAMRAHCDQVRAAGGPNEETHRALHAQMEAEMQAAHREMMAVLTEAQRARLDSLMAAHQAAEAGHEQAGHDMAAMHAQHGEHAPADMARMHEMHESMCPAASPSRR